MANPLKQLAEFGQSFWLDNLSRELIASGELKRLIDEDGLRGITSNPTIFEKALASTDLYDDEIRQLAREGKTAEEIFETLAIHDVQQAADLLRPVYDESRGGDGFVSLELPPALALDTERSIAEAKRLFGLVGRPNVMIKVPGTPPGIPAVEELIYQGVNVNITLLFSVDNYVQVTEAYLRGIERRVAAGLPVDAIASVASFFVSRVDTEVDKRLEQLIARTDDEGRRERLRALEGQVAIANAKVAYERFKEIFLQSERFQRLARENGARLQRPLWASTSTKNPKYSDVKYIEALIGPHTVETMAPVSVDAFRDHGVVAPTLDQGYEEAHRILDSLAEVGISYDDVTRFLQEQGVELFAKSYDSLIAGIAEKTRQVAGVTPTQGGGLGPFESSVGETVGRLAGERFAERLWRRDPTLWSSDPTVQAKIADRLGWLDVAERMLGEIDALARLAEDVRAARLQRAVLLGMGGSSLAPEVFQRTFGNQIDFPELLVLDTTDPDTIRRVTPTLDLERTLFIVSSKSGTTIETSSLAEYYWSLVTERLGERAGERFIAITDPGTPLEALARERRFRHVFLNPPDIGGRYSALSYFGLVPAATIGLNVRDLLERTRPMARRCQAAGDNPGLWLGAALGTLAQQGRDKVTFILDPAVESLADWLEQLLAESTGKDGTGLVPIAHEPLGAPDSYGADRVFVGIDVATQPNSHVDGLLRGLEAAGHPVIRLQMGDTRDLGAEMLRWEVATAVAGAVLGINPFDEPNVQESKDNTSRILRHYRETRTLVEPPPTASAEGVSVVGIVAATVPEALTAFLNQVRLGDYLAIMAFADRTPEVDERLQEIRRLLRERLGVATTLGYGPRFLHSIGQLYKGGPPTGAFLQILAEPRQDVPIPEQDYSFGTLFRAQALGDYEALAARRRPLLRVTLGGDPAAGLERVMQAMVAAAMR